jgi:hypothetical protein
VGLNGNLQEVVHELVASCRHLWGVLKYIAVLTTSLQLGVTEQEESSLESSLDISDQKIKEIVLDEALLCGGQF